MTLWAMIIKSSLSWYQLTVTLHVNKYREVTLRLKELYKGNARITTAVVV